MTDDAARAAPAPESTLEGLSAPITPLAEEYLAVLIVSLAGRLSRGAASYYLRRFEIGMVDYRIVLALGLAKGLNISAVAAAADVDKAAASRCLRTLEERGIVELEQTSSRGRAAIVHLTPAGVTLERELKKSSRLRERRFVSTLTEAERAQVAVLMKKLIAGVPHMNKD
jgi:DNA-binding MarR family transcriptional regulator